MFMKYLAIFYSISLVYSKFGIQRVALLGYSSPVYDFILSLGIIQKQFYIKIKFILVIL